MSLKITKNAGGVLAVLILLLFCSCKKNSPGNQSPVIIRTDSTYKVADTIRAQNADKPIITDHTIKISKESQTPAPNEEDTIDYEKSAKVGLTMLILAMTCGSIISYNNIKRARRFFSRSNDFQDAQALKYIIYDLTINIIKYNFIGFIGLLFLIALTYTLGIIVIELFKNTLRDVIRYQTNNTVLASLLIFLRTSLLGTFILSVMLYLGRFANSAFDQATRFSKRKHAAIFLMELFNKFKLNQAKTDDNNTLNDQTLDAIMKAFREWNVNVESAFTSIKSKGSKESNTKFDDLVYDIIKKQFEKEK